MLVYQMVPSQFQVVTPTPTIPPLFSKWRPVLRSSRAAGQRQTAQSAEENEAPREDREDCGRDGGILWLNQLVSIYADSGDMLWYN